MKVLEMIEILKEYNQNGEVYIDFEETNKDRGVESTSDYTIMTDDGNYFIDSFSMDILRVDKERRHGWDDVITIIPNQVVRC